ncbi:unnamed protein product (macronuclear) [Paramecium tetraurelia]|uniref:Protein kinase domain-containing protein n=1 Tax=Paramecium tetraurelia TaxID=5888 RepID=A0CDL3_PARTE|nr:uncharacterized protein GSPATT00007091001 [Paramecium tetraurelia]CAK68880.1 unnamed protein product [Paramecium tetraurelia]|eukprot:XP_001436277.1 hypothetical protein (macronuclear) [Paramecium tetraurelia strain d4-2]
MLQINDNGRNQDEKFEPQLITKEFRIYLTNKSAKITKSDEHLKFSNKQDEFRIKKHYYLFNQYLIKKNKFINFENCQISYDESKANQLHDSFILMQKQGKKILIQGKIESLLKWFEHLKHYAIQRNFKKQFKKCELLGRGSQAKVFRILNIKTGQTFATKQFEKNKFSESSLEISILRQLDHDGITRLFEVFENKKKIYIILECLNGGELLDQIRSPTYKYNEQFVMDFASNLLKIIGYVHQTGIMHRDLKPENLILKDSNNYTDFAIADFGLAEYYKNEVQYLEKCGTIGYIAPEVLRNQPYNQKIDIYSIGVILYTLFTGTLPFAGNSTQEIYQNNLQAKVNQLQLKQINITEKAKQFVFSLLNENPERRPTAQEALRHEWFKLPPSLTNNLILSTQTNLCGHKKHQKFLSIKCTSPLWNKSKMKDGQFEDSDDSIYNENLQVVKDSIVFNDEDEAELMDEEENQVNQIHFSAKQCEKYYFSNTKIRLLNEKRDQGLF